jgi:hypothetical protein
MPSRWATTWFQSRTNSQEIARVEGEVEGEVLELQPLPSANEEKCSGGETRTDNLAVPLVEDSEEHQLE